MFNNSLSKADQSLLFYVVHSGHYIVILFHCFDLSSFSLKNLGFLIESPQYDKLQSPLGLFSLHEIDWKLIFSQYQSMLMIIFLSITAVLIIVAGTEASIKKEIDFNNEFKVFGIANILSGLIGGMVGYITVNNSILNTEF